MTRERSYSVSDLDLEMMAEIGKFRAVAVEDIERFHHEQTVSRMKDRLRSLTTQGLICRRTLMQSKGEKLRILVLTNAGKRLLEKERGWGDRQSQQVYAGLRKIAEISHDAAIYRMYHVEAARIRSEGGRIRRVVLDYELKRRIFAPLAKARQWSPELYQQRQDEIARANGLVVVDGKIPLPDLRIEYETRAGNLEKVDLELATDHYKDSQVGQTSRAGFKLYYSGGTQSRSGSVGDERELTRGILSL